MKAFLKKVDENLERWLLLVFYIFIVSTIGIEVVRRFILSYSSIWGEEIARYSFIYLVWLGASYAIKDRAHIRIDVLLHYLGAKGKAIAYIVGDLLMLLTCFFAFYYSLETLSVSMKFGSVTHGLRIEQGWFLAAVPIGFSLMIWRLLQSIWRDIQDYRNERDVFEGRKLFD